MKITKTRLREIIRQSIQEEKDYETFFRSELEKTGYSSPAEMSDDDKSEFFSNIDKGWKAKNEGNAFGAAVVKAKEAGEDEFEVGGKTFKVESITKKSSYETGDLVRIISKPKYVVDRNFWGKSGYVKSKMGRDLAVHFPNGRTILVSPVDLEKVHSESVNEESINEVAKSKGYKPKDTFGARIIQSIDTNIRESDPKELKSQKLSNEEILKYGTTFFQVVRNGIKAAFKYNYKIHPDIEFPMRRPVGHYWRFESREDMENYLKVFLSDLKKLDSMIVSYLQKPTLKAQQQICDFWNWYMLVDSSRTGGFADGIMNSDTSRQSFYESVNEAFKHIIHVDTPTQVVSKPIAAQIMALAKKGVRSKEIGLEMGFTGNAKLAADTFQKVKNRIYFELDKKESTINKTESVESVIENASKTSAEMVQDANRIKKELTDLKREYSKSKTETNKTRVAAKEEQLRRVANAIRNARADENEASSKTESVNEGVKLSLVDPNTNKFIKTLSLDRTYKEAEKEIETLNRRLSSSQKTKGLYWKVTSIGESVNESNYDLMFGKLGSGITVSNKKVTDPNTRDYKFIAHISDSGKIDWKDKEAQKNTKVRREVEKRAKSMNESDDCGCGSSKITEGNAFGAAVTQAKKEGKTEFEFNGKTYKVKKGSYEKNEAAKETVNEGISVSDERHFGKKGIIIMIDDGGKKVSAIFKDKKNADKYNRNNPSDVKKLLDLAKKTPYPKAIDESVNEGKHDVMLDKLASIVKDAKSFMDVGKVLKSNGIKYSFSTSMIPMYKIDKHPIAIVNKKYAAGAEREIGDIAIGLLESIKTK